MVQTRSWLTARLEDGDLRVSVLAAGEYTGPNDHTREAAHAVDVPEKDLVQVRKAMETLLEAYSPMAIEHAEEAAIMARSVARQYDVPDEEADDDPDDE